ncbi:unnamed protein product [Lampetra planeri]
MAEPIDTTPTRGRNHRARASNSPGSPSASPRTRNPILPPSRPSRLPPGARTRGMDADHEERARDRREPRSDAPSLHGAMLAKRPEEGAGACRK